MLTPEDITTITTIVREQLGLRQGEVSLIGEFAGSAPLGSSTIRKGLEEKGEGSITAQLPHIAAAVAPAVVSALVASPAFAALLYQRIGDGTWEQLNKFGNQVGYKPPKGEAQ